MRLRFLVVGAIAVIILGALVWGTATYKPQEYLAITSFEQCAVAGYPIMESYPEQCKTPDGRNFVRDISGDQQTNAVQFDTLFTIAVNKSVMFPDGHVITMKEITDSRCKPDVQCIWAGELSVLLIAGGREIRLGTVNNKTSLQGGYTYTLQSATEVQAKLLVSKVVVSKVVGVSTYGSLTGYVHIGPNCPVERIPRDPNCEDKPYAVSIEIHNLDERLYSIISSDADGKFEVNLPVGSYILRPQVANVLPACEEERVIVVENKTISVDISCDSGIR